MARVTEPAASRGQEQVWSCRCRAGDRAAFGELFDGYAAVVYRYAVRVTGNWATAEDIVSLSRAWDRLRTLTAADLTARRTDRYRVAARTREREDNTKNGRPLGIAILARAPVDHTGQLPR